MTRFPYMLTAALVAVILALLTGGVMFYRAQEQQVRQQVEERLTAISRLKVDQIAAWRAERLDEGAKLIDRPLLVRQMARWLTNPRIDDQEALLAEFRVLQRHDGYFDILVLDQNGRVRLSLSGRFRGIETETQALVAARRDGRPVLTDLHTEADDSSPHISVVVPVFAGDGQARRPLGAVILLTDARRFLYPLVQSWPTPSATAETLLVRRDGGDVLFLNDLRHRADTALTLRIPLSQTNVPAVMAVQGKEGIVEGLDYRGARVVSVLQPIPNSPWFIVAKVDTAEAFAGWRTQSRLILALVLGLVIVTGVGGLVIWQRNEKTHYRALFRAEAARRQSEERHRITLMSVGDGVISTDTEGRIEAINPVAEILTGWAGADARGRSLDEVLRIVNEETRQPVESPVARVLREGRVVGLANHTVLLARGGTERPIADSGAPIRDEDGSLTGVVLVFRDQSKERAFQKGLTTSESRYRRLFETARDGIFLLDASSGEITDANPFLLELLGYSREEILGRRLWEISPFRDIAANQEAFQELQAMEFVRYEHLPLETRVGKAVDVEFVSTVYRVNNHRIIQCNIRDITNRKRLEGERVAMEARLRQQQKLEAIGTLASGVAHEINNPINGIMNYAQLIADTAPAGSQTAGYTAEIVKETERVATTVRNLLQFARQEPQTYSLARPADIVEQTLSLFRAVLLRDLITLTVDVPADLPALKCRSQQLQQVLMNLLTNARDALNEKYPSYHKAKTLRVSVAPFDHDGRRWLRLTVADQGPGIPPEIQARIFDPFFTTKLRDKGTGLGLSISHGIVQDHHGVLHFETELGAGTQFHLDLPVEEE